MPIPDILQRNLRLPLIAAPMFLLSNPELVIAACRAGVIGTFPSLNQRTTEGFDAWLAEIASALGPDDAAWGVNLIVHATNARLKSDLEVTLRHRPPLVITSFGAVRDVVEAIHGYGGVVFHDVISVRHARKAAEAGVDGLVLLAAGAGGHTGSWSPFALINEVRAFFSGTIILSGALSTGGDVASALMMGADLAYMGTRFIATEECPAAEAHKAMIVGAAAADVTVTTAVTGVAASFLLPSLSANGVDPAALAPPKDDDREAQAAKAWRDLWSAGQGVGSIAEVLPVAALVEQLEREFAEAKAAFHRRTA